MEVVDLATCSGWIIYEWVSMVWIFLTKHTVPLNYNFTFTRFSTRSSRGKCQKLPWKASSPCDGLWLFHAMTRGISWHVAFPRDDMWHFHETSRGISMTPVAVEFPWDQSPWNLAWNFHETSSRGGLCIFFGLDQTDQTADWRHKIRTAAGLDQIS